MKINEIITEWDNERFRQIQKGFRRHAQIPDEPSDQHKNTVRTTKVSAPKKKLQPVPPPSNFVSAAKKRKQKKKKKKPMLTAQQRSAKTWAQNTAQCIRDGGKDCI